MSSNHGFKECRLPHSQRVLVDVIEWYAHCSFLESSTEMDIQFASEQIDSLCKLAFSKNDENDNKKMTRFRKDHDKQNMQDNKPNLQCVQYPFFRRGRVWNRILLSSLVHNICGRKQLGSDPDALINMKPEDWEEIILNLQECRTCLMKSNASMYPPEGFDTVDDTMLQLPMLNEVFTEVLELLQCHEAIAQFRHALQNASSNKEFHLHLDTFTNALPHTIEIPSQLQQDSQKSARQEQPFNIILNLVNFVRMDLLSSPKRNTDLCSKTRSHFKQLMNSRGKSYSFDVLQSKVKALIRTWNDVILGIPTLVKLGYGGIRVEENQGATDDAKSVSSWGMEEVAEGEPANMYRDGQYAGSSDAAEGGEEEEYHTADEMDNRDDPITSNEKATMGLSEVTSLEIRPRQSWRESFEMIEDSEDEERCLDQTPRNENKKKRRKQEKDLRLQLSDLEVSLEWSSQNSSLNRQLRRRRRVRQEKMRKLVESNDNTLCASSAEGNEQGSVERHSDMQFENPTQRKDFGVTGVHDEDLNPQKVNPCFEDENLAPLSRSPRDVSLPASVECQATETGRESCGPEKSPILFQASTKAGSRSKRKRRRFFHEFEQMERQGVASSTV